jgi:hypothetical protein
VNFSRSTCAPPREQASIINDLGGGVALRGSKSFAAPSDRKTFAALAIFTV